MERIIEDYDTARPDVERMREKLAEARAAARAIYESYPDPSPVEDTYVNLIDMLDRLDRALGQTEERVP